MTSESELNREIGELCFRVGLDVLAGQLDAVGADPEVLQFAARFLNRSRGMSDTEIERLFKEGDLRPRTVPEVSGAQLIPETDEAAIEETCRKSSTEAAARAVERDSAAAKFISNFILDLFAAPLVARSNSKRVRMLEILTSAVEECCFEDEEEGDGGGLWERLQLDLTRAESFIFEEPDDARFRRGVYVAFERAVKCGLDFVALAEAIQDEKRAEELRAVRRRLRLIPHGKRSASSIAEDELKRLLR